MKREDVLVIGAGPAGIMACLAAAREGASVLCLDAGEQAAAKIPVTGNGRCNLTNLSFDGSCYYSDSDSDPMRFFRERDNLWLLTFFRENGMLLRDRDGYVYPRSNEAKDVQHLLQVLLAESGIRLRTGIRILEAYQDAEGFCAVSEKERFFAKRLVIACGGRGGRTYRCFGDGYTVAKSFGHRVIPAVPGLCPIAVQDQALKAAAGLRTQGAVSLFAGEQMIRRECGELQLAAGKISGIPAFQVSRIVGRFAQQGKTEGLRLSVDFLHDVPAEELREELERRLKTYGGDRVVGDLFAGLIPGKLAAFALWESGIALEKKLKKLEEADRQKVISLLLGLKDREFVLTGETDFEKAQVSAGGIDASQLEDSGESRLVPGLYFAGEVIDVDGICGGYNLTFAFCTGYSAGLSAAASLQKRT